MSRDWRDHLNSLVHCHGCGRFGLPPLVRAGVRAKAPSGWRLLYQPHADAPPMLLACGDSCADRVRTAMLSGPVREPLETATDVLMAAELREAMMNEFRTTYAEDPFPAANEPPGDLP